MPQGGLGIAPGPALCPALRLSEAFEERGDGHDRRRVSYGTASIHYFPVAPSDNPAVSSGVGVAIAGAAELCEVVEVEDHRPLGARRRPVRWLEPARRRAMLAAEGVREPARDRPSCRLRDRAGRRETVAPTRRPRRARGGRAGRAPLGRRGRDRGVPRLDRARAARPAAEPAAAPRHRADALVRRAQRAAGPPAALGQLRVAEVRRGAPRDFAPARSLVAPRSEARSLVEPRSEARSLVEA